jgi:WD40 repeat protein
LLLADTGYVLDCTLAAACDVGMVSAWSHTGGLMATAHQDGTAAVWDPRSSRLVARYDTGPGAARNVKFAAAPVDLLAVAEHTGVVHLLDARRWDSVHQLVLPLPHAARTGQAADISGIAFTAHVSGAIQRHELG